MRGVGTLVPIATLTALLAACSSSGPTGSEPTSSAATTVPAPITTEPETAKDLLARSEAALLAAPSFRMKSTGTFGAIKLVTEAIYVGDNVQGTQTIEGLKTEFIGIGNDLYIKGSEAYWFNKVPLDHLGQVVNKWVKVDADDPTHAPLARPFDRKSLDDAATSGTLTRDGTATIGGRSATVIKSSTGAVVYIAADGEPYPLRLEGSASIADGTAKATVDFSDFGAITTTIHPPPPPFITITKS